MTIVSFGVLFIMRNNIVWVILLIFFEKMIKIRFISGLNYQFDKNIYFTTYRFLEVSS
jgi:hypothetical protein